MLLPHQNLPLLDSPALEFVLSRTATSCVPTFPKSHSGPLKSLTPQNLLLPVLIHGAGDELPNYLYF